MKKGFTLAEVLITLAIIGVVAALTIPTVVHKYQQKAQYTAFMKMYNTLQTAMQLASVEEGSPNTWDYTLSMGDFIDRYIAPYVKNHGHDDSYADPSVHVKDLTGQDKGPSSAIMTAYNMPDFLILEDGSAISSTAIEPNVRCIYLLVDTNGAKEPNTMGRDMFTIRYGYDSTVDKSAVGFLRVTDSYVENCCNTSSNSCSSGIQGESCGLRMAREGKMDY